MEIENRLFRRRRSENSIDAGSLEKITGFELEKGLDVTSLVKRYKNLGFQASQLGRAAELLERMKKEEASIFLSCSANIISSGLREIVAQLVKLKLVKGIVATTAFVEEDVIKTLSPFL
ncbi:MAG: deoxyhypusine synthase family protein, partial [Candidatus Woesearchaeota archaeon]